MLSARRLLAQVFHHRSVGPRVRLTLRTLRFYEDRGLISPTREGSTRLYSQRDRARLAMIVRAKALGFTLSEIKETLAEGTLAGEPHGLALSSSQIADQIAHLEKQQADLDAALANSSALRSEARGTSGCLNPNETGEVRSATALPQRQAQVRSQDGRLIAEGAWLA